MHVNDFFRRNLEFEKEHANGGTMANLHIKGTFAATVDISLLIRMSSNSCLCLTVDTLLCVKLSTCVLI